jgi:hypothetical protein
MGQLIHDLPGCVYRWRQIMPVAVSLDQLGPESPETVGARELVNRHQVKISRDDRSPSGLRILAGKVGDREKEVEVVLDGDGRILRGKCTCSHHFQFRLRKGPCRHLQALRTAATSGQGQTANVDTWFAQLWN